MPSDQLRVSYEYWDGSGNRYALDNHHGEYLLVFDPVQPAMSSSGIYSGGVAQSVKPDNKLAQSLLSAFEQALNTTEKVSERREMGTGIIKRNHPQIAKIILQADSVDKIRLEGMLQSCLKMEE